MVKNMKKTKLICTIGPSCVEEGILREMIFNGMDVLRVNLSHSTHEFAEEVVRKIRKLNKELNTNVGILFDTRGPEIRVGTFPNGFIELFDDTEVILTPNKVSYDDNKININQRNLYLSLDIDSVILIDDGNIELVVIGIDNEEIICRVIHGGVLKDNKGLNFPNTDLDIDFLSASDKNDILFASQLDVDFIALSFVRSANDILDVNDILIGEKNEHTQIISKIENRSAIDDIESIVKVSDGIMVARGDLGVEIALEKLPCIQKDIAKICRQKNKICIVATQMLASMENKSRPTRAEVSDVANAVIDNVDAVMLSGETAIGKYPIDAVKIMSKIIVETESHIDYDHMLNYTDEKTVDGTTVLANSTVIAANMLNAKAIVVSTMSGYTARKVSNYRPECPIITTTPNKNAARSLTLNWGVIPVVVDKISNTDEMIEVSVEVVKSKMKLESKDKIIITGGFPMRRTHSTNFIKIEEID